MKARDHSAFRDQPEAYFSLVPELEAVDWPVEIRADCSDCVMVRRPGESPARPRHFLSDVRCCGFHPRLPNFYAGRALREDAGSAAVVRARMTDPKGVCADGIWPQPARVGPDPFAQRRHFGLDASFRCPFWVGGSYACGIWRHREGVCRTWFCLHVDGARGAALWDAARVVVSRVDRTLARWCVGRGSPPAEGAPVEDWAQWYVECADRLDSAEAAELAGLRDAELDEGAADLRARDAERSAPVPDVVEPAIGLTATDGEHLLLYGEAFYDPVPAPREIFAFLSRLDGAARWRDVLDELGEQGGIVPADDLILRLVHVGALRPPEE